jgi:protein SCO1
MLRIDFSLLNKLIFICVVVTVFLFSSYAFTTYAQENKACHSSSKKERQVLKAAIPDVEVLNQEGKKIHFYRDLVKGKVVVINFIFTTCTAICPMAAHTFSKIQNLTLDRPGNRIGKDFHLISISIDPENDTPERLRDWGLKFKARPGWTFITGNKLEIDKLVRALTGNTARKGMHAPYVLIGNDDQQTWTSTSSLTSPSKLISVINKVVSK